MLDHRRVIGRLDAMVKSGEVSEAYAAGVRSVLEKRATWWPWPDSPWQNYTEEQEAFYADKPEGYRPTTEEQNKMIDRSRHWYDYKGFGLGYGLDYLGNRARKLMRWWPTVSRDAASYDEEWRKYVADDRQRYITANLDNGNMLRAMRDIAGAESGNNNEINLYNTGTHRYMSAGERFALGIPEDPQNIEFSPTVNGLIRGGAVKPYPNPDFNRPGVPMPVYRDPLSNGYGGSESLFRHEKIGYD